MKKILKLMVDVFLLLLIFSAVFFGGLRLVGYKPYVVLTGSMEPALPVNSVVFVEEVKFTQLYEDNIITFINDESGETVTHRIVSVDKEDKSVRTKGDANEYEDVLPVYEENIIGRMKFSIPKIGKIVNIINETFHKLRG